MTKIAEDYNADLKEHLARKPGEILESVAGQYGLSLFATIRHLPAEMWKVVPGAEALNILADVASWGDVTTIIHTEDVIFEFKGPFPEGKSGRGYYNLIGSGTPEMSGHLSMQNCQHVVFLERPFMGRPSAAIIFFNARGAAMFKIFVGRDEARELKRDQLERFEQWKNRK
ncbi:MAG: heme utilization cystosolic carrier protein HutX [Spirochaetales bacterium]|nr:heme utilization cystosolic carrier protein HutX [Spirochaetales bacterium]